MLANDQTQQRAVARPLECFVRRCVVFVKLSKDLNALFTASESTNDLAISGSSITILAPSDRRRL